MCETELTIGRSTHPSAAPAVARACLCAVRPSALPITILATALVVTLATPRAFAQANTSWFSTAIQGIPDDNSSGMTDTINIPAHGSILDLDLRTFIDHSRPGDVVVTLTHVDTGTTATLIDRPGYSGTGVGCQTDEIDVTLDDEGPNTVEDECNPGISGIDGRVIPNQPLSIFDGEDINGTWEINVSDHAATSTGTFVNWGLAATLDPLPDGFGYRLATSSDPGGPAFNFVDISATGLFAVMGDNTSSRNPPPNGISSAIPLSSPFTFYGVTYHQLVMASNGYLTTDVGDFGPDDSNDCVLPAAPSDPPATPGARIYVLHDNLDLVGGFGQGLHQYFASCPRPYDGGGDVGCQVFMWDDVADAPGGGAADMWDMEAILYDNGDIVFQYASGTPDSHARKTIGIQSAAPHDFGLTYACDATGFNRTGFLSSFLAIWIFLDADGDGFPDAAPDTDADGTPDYRDGCPNDPNKLAPGTFGCGVSDADADGDGVPDHLDNCPNDPAKLDPGLCGCGTPDSSTDTDADGVIDCLDGCPNDPNKNDPGTCGCGTPDSAADTDADGIIDCVDNCPNASNADQADADADGIGDACAGAPAAAPGCGCGAGAGLMVMPLFILGVWRMRRRRP